MSSVAGQAANAAGQKQDQGSFDNHTMSDTTPTDPLAEFESETANFREVLAKGRSSNQLALFDLLVERSRDERSPKEVEIALELFGSDTTLDAASDSGVRVYVHRLRKRIDEYYAGKFGRRLTIPKGEYRIVLEHVPEPDSDVTMLAAAGRLLSANPALSLGLLLIILAGFAFASYQLWAIGANRPNAAQAERQILLGSGESLVDPLIAIGDSLLLAETEDQKRVDRMVLNPAIRSRDDLGRFIKAHPEEFYKLYDFNLHFAPTGAVEAAWIVQGELAIGAGNAGQVPLIPVSELDEERQRHHDVIYVGRLSQLGTLEMPVFAQSRFTLASFDRLVDKTNGQALSAMVYSSDPSRTVKDIGYIAVRNTPSGRRLIVLAGLGERGTTAMAELLQDPFSLSALTKRLGNARTFEAVYAVEATPGRATVCKLIGAWRIGNFPLSLKKRRY